MLDYFIYNVVGRQFCKESLCLFECHKGHKFLWHSARNKTCQVCYNETNSQVPAKVIARYLPCEEDKGKDVIKLSEFYRKGIAVPNYEECPFKDICDSYGHKKLAAPKSISIMGQTGWTSAFRSSICDYGYYVDFEKVYGNIDSIKVELHILNSLVGSRNVEEDFSKLVAQYPQVLKCIPILLAVRSQEIYAVDSDGEFLFNFTNANYSIEEYKMFMRKTGLFRLISERIINNLVDYVTGVEVGLDSNGRKNRGGHLMENLVESYLRRAGLHRDIDYFKEMYISDIERKWSIDLSNISNQGKAEKRFDFVVKKGGTVYGIETNFYTGGGSKLNETARSYKTIALEAKEIQGFAFVWFTDGKGWLSARHNLEETFDVMENVYCIAELESGVADRLFKD